MKKITLTAVSVALALGLVACGKAPQTTENSTAKAEQSAAPAVALVSGVDKENFDNTVRLQDDFFLAINGGWLNKTEIPADKASYGSFHVLADNSQLAVKTIIEEVSSRTDLAPGSDEQKLGSYYNSYMNEAKLEELGLTPLQPQLELIQSLQDKKQLAAVFASLQRDGVSIPWSWYVNNDAKNSSQYAVYADQSGLGLPDRDYYLKDDEHSKKIQAEYQSYLQDLMTLAKHPDPANAAKRVYALEKQLAELQWTRVQNRDAEKTYNKVTAAELSTMLGDFSWADFAAGAKLASVNELIIGQPSYFAALPKVIAETDLASWQDYLRFHTVNSFADKLNKAVSDRQFQFYGTVLSGTTEQKPRWKRAVASSDSVLGELTGKLYVERHFKPEAKARMEQLVANLIKAYEVSIKELSWMSEDTKKAALAKLATFTPKIGYPNKWKDYSALEIKADDLVGNTVRSNHWGYDQMLAKLGKPIDKDEWFMTPQTVNAYYNPVNNEIVFPAAILQPPFFNMAAEDAVNYGGIGAVIGHEIGHGFDDQGAKFDGDGNLRNWWTTEDESRFKALTQALSAQYSKFEPVPGHFVNGDLTLGENIGDLGGLTVALKAYELSLNGQPAPVLDGYTGEQRVLLSWAQVWRSKYRDAAMQQMIATDPHSPPHYRVNGILSNLPQFYTAFDVKPTDKMYIAPENRVKIW
ncbi:M13-type metalloendopeptidase [Rheinheimera sp.]|uniref:M13 family metallopeptidase n=1 Tax=Rheinheimera sp. TaxID=1869214 RepID=UPI00307F0A68